MKKILLLLLIISVSVVSASSKKIENVNELKLDSVETSIHIDSIETLFSFPMISVGEVSFSNENEKKKQKSESASDSLPNVGLSKKQIVDFFVQNVIYPIELKQKAAEEYLKVRFKVEKDGKIKNPKVINSKFPEIEKEVLRVVEKMPFYSTDSISVKSKKQKKNNPTDETTVEVPISFRLMKL
ncbi:MAG: hypothetical protein GX102_09495 [Porphyromonadaceae bacterium]|nr:hypothetical protein [Porphyromonadaceae bacterium]